MGLIIDDDLEGYAVGQAPFSPWVVKNAAGGGAVTVENDPVAGAARGKVIRLTDTDVADYSEAKLPLGTTRDALVVVLEVLLAQVTKNVYVGVVASGVRHDVLSFRSDAFVKYRLAGGTWTNFPTSMSYAANQWYKARLVLDRNAANELVMVTVDETDRLTSAVNLDAIAAAIDAIYVATDSAQDNVTAYVNDVQVLDKATTIQGTVVGADGATKISGAKVCLFRTPGGTTILQTATTGAPGTYSFSLDAGVYVSVGAYDPAVARGGAGHSWIWAI